jgi:NAD(P)-dependent dehydrogenase (short-subunit alcohol dehydrogenase family)
MTEDFMKGRVCLVTGATSGIGKVTARALADKGATVVFVARDAERAAATRRWILDQTGNHSVDYLIADLSSRDSVYRLAGEFSSRYPGLDVLVNNAGAFFPNRMESADGIEMTFALNHLGPFLLTNLLLDAIRRRAPSRIVTVSSGAHTGAKMDWADLEGRSRYSGWRAYGQSKLANLLFTYELARRLEGTGVTANALHPGFVATGFGHNGRGATKAMIGFAQRFMAISPEEGAKTSIYLASSPEVEGVTGKYFVKCKPVQSSPASYRLDDMRRLWDLSMQQVRLPVAA